MPVLGRLAVDERWNGLGLAGLNLAEISLTHTQQKLLSRCAFYRGPQNYPRLRTDAAGPAGVTPLVSLAPLRLDLLPPPPHLFLSESGNFNFYRQT